jgi:hypothetical protein
MSRNLNLNYGIRKAVLHCKMATKSIFATEYCPAYGTCSRVRFLVTMEVSETSE